MLSTHVRRSIHQALPHFLQRGKALTGQLVRYAAGRFARIEEDPIFVIGNQKSGTTVLAAALAHAANMSVTLDIRDLSIGYLLDLYEGVISVPTFLNRYRRAFSREVIKEPGLTFAYEKLRVHYPESPFVFVVRDPRDNIRSILNRLGLPGTASSLSSDQLAELNPIWRHIVNNRALGVETEHYIESLAHRWNRGTDIYLHHSDRICLARYEQFCSEKTKYIESILQALDLSVVQSPKSVVETQHQPQGNRSISWDAFFGPENLSRIEHICSENMNVLNYRHS